MTGKAVIGRKAHQARHVLMASCALSLATPAIALAADITVPDGTTVTTTQTLTDIGDTGTIDSGGTIDVVDEDGLVLDNDDQTAVNNGDILVERTSGVNLAGIGSNEDNADITNNGQITTTGNNAFGVAGDGDDMNVTNNGSISTTGNSSVGILALGDGATVENTGTIHTTGAGAQALAILGTDVAVTNSGTLATAGDGAHAIDTDGDNASVTNSGTISTSGQNADGFDSDGDDVALTNSGTINLSGDGSDGIDNDGNRASINNSGTIGVSGEDSNGIESDGDDVTIVNSGLVRNTGTQSGSDPDSGHGVWTTDSNVTVINSGTITSANGSSIYMDGSNATVTLNEGTVLQGLLSFSDPTTATLNYAAGRTAILTFNSVPGTLTTGGIASSTSGNTVTYLNPDDFQLGATSLTFNALSRELADVVEEQMNTVRLSGSASVATNGTPAETVTERWSVWASPFGGFLSRDGSDGFDHSFGGLMAGADRGFGQDSRAGITAGFSLGHTESDDDIHSADTYSLFTGAYAMRNWQETFAQFSILGGYLNSAEDVTVLNNMVAGGLQDLSIDYDYFFLTPTVRAGRAVALSQGTLTPSLRARYSGLWQSGNASETSTGLTVSERSLNVLELRGETAFEFAPVVAETGALHVGLAAGVDGVFTLSDDANGNFAGSALNLSIDNDDAVIRGFGRANAIWKSNGSASFLASVEGGYDSAETLSATMRLGGKISF